MSWLTDLFWRKYVSRLSKPDQQARNRKYLNRALLAYGYGNSSGDNGESFLIHQVLPRLAPDVVFDIGANVGNYSRPVLKALPEATVHSFEPLEEPLARLRELSTEFGARAIAVPLGVGNRNQSLDIRFNPDATSHASFSPEASDVPYVANHETRAISVTTLDSYCADNLGALKVGFMKIDTEGFELEVLEGASTVIQEHCPKAVQIEFNWHHMFRSHSLYHLGQHLKGYELFQLVPGGMARRDIKDPLSNIFMFSNFVFLREDQVGPLERAGLRF